MLNCAVILAQNLCAFTRLPRSNGAHIGILRGEGQLTDPILESSWVSGGLIMVRFWTHI